jgi:DNA-directed RNA polymerase beta subunit/intein/homing endonuclease
MQKQFKNKLKYKITSFMLSLLITNQSTITEKMNTDNSSIKCNIDNNTNGYFDIENDQYIETPWTIIGSYFKDHHLLRLVRHQIESYNNFVGYQIIKTIEMFNPVHIASEQDYDTESKKYALEIFITFENFHIYRPQIHENNGAIKLMFPQEARLRNFTYASAMTIDINIKYVIRTGKGLENIQTFYKTLSKIHIGKLPIMLKSNICVLNQYKHFENTQTGECKYDAGGYFIINGSEKTVLGQERAAENRVYCFNVSKNNTKYTWTAEIKSVPDFKCISPKQINMMINSKNNGFGNPICIQIPRVKQPLPLFIIFRALGVLTDQDICNKILLDINADQNSKMLDALQASIIEANAYLTKEECIKYIMGFVMYTPINMDKDTGAKKKYEFTMDILSNDLFPHCHSVTQKIYFLGYMTYRLLLASFEITKQDDRDSYVNKRVDLTGTLLNNLFRNYFNKLVKDMEKQIIREINTGSWKSTDNYENIINLTNIYKIVKSTTIENGLKRALATGDFGIKHTNSNKVGVAQVLNRLTYVSSLSHARRISTPTDKSGKLVPPRKLHNTSWGFACLTGDVDVLLANRIDTKKIKDIKNGDWVNSVNRENLLDEPSDMYNYFCKMPDNLFEITTVSGRKIKATSDHPFLVRTSDGKYEMKKVEDLKINDKLIIRHTVISIPDENKTFVKINEADVLEHYRMSLLELNLLNTDIPVYKLKIIARLLGALNTDGHLGVKNDEDTMNQYYYASFNVGEEYDVYQLADDINVLGFGNVSIRRKISKFEDKNNGRTTTSTTWEVAKSGPFGYFMYLMGGFSGKKINIKRSLPEWLINAELSVKREFLSGFQGGDGSRLSYQKNGENCKPNLGITIQTTHNDYLNDTIEYITQIITMFKEFNIDCRLKTTKAGDEKTKVCVVFNKNTENLIKYADIINYSYCEEKRRTSAPVIEHLKIRGHNKIQREINYQFIIDNYKTEKIEILIEKTKLSENQIKKVISNHKKGICQSTRFTTDLVYENFIRENIVDNGCLSIPIESIKEIEPEMVYDFTTRSENHSFVASSFVLSNCPAETPEGQSVGIVKNLSYMTHVTIHSNSLPLYEYVMPHIVSIDAENIISKNMYEKVKVFINGAWVGITDNPQELFMMLKDKKYKGIINIYTSIVFDYRMKEIRVCNDSGRLTRPVLRVKDKNILLTKEIIHKLNAGELTWDDLLTSSVINESVLEYIDPEEQSWSMIATVPKDIIKKTEQIYKFTHCEIHPSTIFGILASCIPFPEHNQSPRNTYQCAQGKQAMGVYVTNYENRMDKTAYVLNYPTRPLVDTRIMNMIQLNKIPSGTNVIVAIMTHTGYNQEDSLLINKGSIDRGLALVTVYHTEKDEDKQKINGDDEIRCKPDGPKTKGMKMGNYNKVNSKGVIPENTLVENRDIIIAKVTPIKENRNDPTKVIKFEDQSKIYKTNEETYIDKNYIDRNGEGYNFAKVRLRTVRKPVIGDKFSSRHGQKGTVGNIIPECDMPFTRDGVKPDIIINPHAIPSRMTIGQLKETVLGKVLLQLGLFGDGTSFGQFDVNDICKELLKVGYEAHGNELLYNGLTGEQHECSVFMGPVFYQRLKHMVNDKAHSRSIGPMVNLTRQPAEGRSRDGGLRFGEMERDCEYENTEIAMTNGLSIYIKNMEDCESEVLGWDEKTNKLIPSKQSGFMYKGERECVKLTFEDGRTNICTPEHPILTSDNQWIKAKDLLANQQKVKAGITCPVIDFNEEIKECNGWQLRVGDLLFKTDTKENYIKTLVFAKIIGYLITDGNISKCKGHYKSIVFLGHMIDVNSFLGDLKLLCKTKQTNFISKNLYSVRIPAELTKNIVELGGIIIGKKVSQQAQVPEFILDKDCPLSIVREFLGGMFGGDGHTSLLGMHRGKRDILSSISFSQTKNKIHLESLTQMFKNIQQLLSRFGIVNTTIQKFKETSYSKGKSHIEENNKNYQLTLHLDMNELIPFHDKIGFRYCCHKSQRLEASVSYKRLRNEVTRQHNWLINRVDEITNFSKIKKEFPNKIVPTKNAIIQAVEELKKEEPLIHEYAIPTTHDMTDNLIKGTTFGKFTSKSFPNAEEYLKEIGALEWFLEKHDIENIIEEDNTEEDNTEEEEDNAEEDNAEEENNNKNNIHSYGVNRECDGLPTMELKVIDIRPAGIHKVYDIQVDNTHSFLANGVVAHNCMVSHGASRFTKERMYDVSDKYSVFVCNKCGLIASYNDKMHIHHCRTCDNRTDFSYVQIPYSCKLLFQELNTMNIAPRIMTHNK